MTAGARIEELTTRLLVAPLPRPWGPDVPAVHVIVVDVRDSDGAVGTGFTWTPTIGARAVQAMIEHDIRPHVLGGTTDARATWEPLWRQLHEAGGGGIVPLAMAGLDLALWDLAGRRAGRSVASLLGRRHETLAAYGSGVNLHLPPEELLEQVDRWIATGFDAVKIKVGRPDLRDDLDRVRRVRDALGPDRRLMLDANQRWDLDAATRAIDALAPYAPAWMEEPLRADDTAGYVALRGRSAVPIAMGENLSTWYRFRDVLDAGAVDVAQPNVVRVGGITPFLEIARLVGERGAVLAPHLLADLSAQVAVCLETEVMIEEVEDSGFERLGLLTQPSPLIRDGAAVRVEERPGLGLAFR